MAFGIDDALAAAAAAINLTDTVVETIKRCRRDKKDQDLELLIEEIRITALNGSTTQISRLFNSNGSLPNQRRSISTSVSPM